LEHFIARQPIFDRNGKVYAYELLFRSGLHNYFDAADQDQAAASVIANSSLLFGLNEMSAGAKVFVNCTHKVLVEDFMTVLPKEQAVVEVLENVTPDGEVIAACLRLKQQGYILALDDFVYHDNWEPLLQIADIIKVDFLDSGAEEQEQLAKMMIPRGIRMLAEKVETIEDYEQAKAMGYQLFQGYFFSKPVIISRKDIPTNKYQFLRILKDIYSEDIEFQKLAKTIQSEVSLSYKLLKLINSAAFALRHKVTNILQALSLLGIREIRNWVSLLSVSAMADDKPAELVVISLVRAKFCEQLAEPCNLRGKKSELFLMGLFSLLDVIMSRPLDEILEEITIDESIQQALLGGGGTMRDILQLILAIEKANWDEVTGLSVQLGINEQPLNEAYMDAIKWAHKIYNL